MTSRRGSACPPPGFPDAGVAFDLVEQAGFEIPADGVRTVAQRRSFSRDKMLGFLKTQATVPLTRATSGDTSKAIVQAAVADIERMRRFDGTYDQTFVRLEIMVQRHPALPVTPSTPQLAIGTSRACAS